MTKVHYFVSWTVEAIEHVQDQESVKVTLRGNSFVDTEEVTDKDTLAKMRTEIVRGIMRSTNEEGRHVEIKEPIFILFFNEIVRTKI